MNMITIVTIGFLVLEATNAMPFSAPTPLGPSNEGGHSITYSRVGKM